MKLKTDPMVVAQLQQMMEMHAPIKKPFDADEDFINYLHTFAHSIQQEMQETKDKGRLKYYRGMLYSLKAISQVYETLLKGEYI